MLTRRLLLLLPALGLLPRKAAAERVLASITLSEEGTAAHAGTFYRITDGKGESVRIGPDRHLTISRPDGPDA